MNKSRRKRISEIILALSRILAMIDRTKDSEQDSLDNVPESIQDSEQCQVMEDAISNLEDAISLIEQAVESLERAKV